MSGSHLSGSPTVTHAGCGSGAWGPCAWPWAGPHGPAGKDAQPLAGESAPHPPGCLPHPQVQALVLSALCASHVVKVLPVHWLLTQTPWASDGEGWTFSSWSAGREGDSVAGGLRTLVVGRGRLSQVCVRCTRRPILTLLGGLLSPHPVTEGLLTCVPPSQPSSPVGGPEPQYPASCRAGSRDCTAGAETKQNKNPPPAPPSPHPSLLICLHCLSQSLAGYWVEKCDGADSRQALRVWGSRTGLVPGWRAFSPRRNLAGVHLPWDRERQLQPPARPL